MPVQWRVETMRLTVFPAGVTDPATVTWWQDVAGVPSDSRTLQPRLGALQEVGTIRDGLCNLTLEVQPNRIDWAFTPVIGNVQRLDDFPTFANLQDGLALYREITSRWIATFRNVNRIAFGAALIAPVESRRAGYEALTDYLPAVELDPENSSDFSYQINRPRLARSVPDLQLNRLSRWSVVRLSGMFVQVTAGQPSAVVFDAGQDRNGCRLELDINTAPQDPPAIPNGREVDVLDELVGLGSEIAERGDIR
jgi:hypothetical protein